MSFMDPYWRKAMYPGRCARCRTRFRVGALICFVPRTRRTYCSNERCGASIMRPIEDQAVTEARELRAAIEAAEIERSLGVAA